MAIKITIDNCTGCGVCMHSCPVKAITVKNRIAIIDQDRCSECGSCVTSCPAQAMKLE